MDYESEHHLYHLLLKAMEVESTLSSVTEVHGSLHFLPTVSAIFVTSLAGPVTHTDSLETLKDAQEGGGLMVQAEGWALSWVQI